MGSTFDKAVQLDGKDYLVAERDLRTGGQPAIDVLQARLVKVSDPIAKLIAFCLLEWIQGKVPEFQDALDYLDYMPERLAKTPRGVPSPIGVANELNERFASKVTGFLALRLLKEPLWPRWKSLGVIYYLKEQASDSTTSALLRFAVNTHQQEMRDEAIKAIIAIADPALELKVVAERNRSTLLQIDFPPELTALLL